MIKHPLEDLLSPAMKEGREQKSYTYIKKEKQMDKKNIEDAINNYINNLESQLNDEQSRFMTAIIVSMIEAAEDIKDILQNHGLFTESK
jgi:hypothetical protein